MTMNQTVWLTLLVLVSTLSGVVVLSAFTRRGLDSAMGAVASAITSFLWAVVGLQSFSGIASTTECCTTFERHTGLGWMFVIFSLMAFVLTLVAALDAVKEE